MNTRKLRKTLLTLCSALLLVSLSVGMTIAYLTDTTDVVKNTFTVGNVYIMLDETDVDNSTPDKARDTENAYHLLPGQTYVKDPMVTVEAGSEACYVRMFVTINKLSELKAIFGNTFLPQNYVTGWDSNVWVSTNIIDEDTEANTATYEFRYNGIVPASVTATELDPLFETIELPGNVTNTQLATIAGLEINVVAEAIQAAGFEDNAAGAWAALDAEYHP